MKRLPASLASLAALCALMFGLSGCNVRFSPYAAVVNGSVISQSQLRDALAAVVNNAGYKCSIESGGTSSHTRRAGEGTYNATFSAQMLSILIQDKVVRQEVARMRLAEPSTLEPVGPRPAPGRLHARERLHGNGRLGPRRVPRLLQTAAGQVPAGRGRAERTPGGNHARPGSARRLRGQPQDRDDVGLRFGDRDRYQGDGVLRAESDPRWQELRGRWLGRTRSTRRPQAKEGSSGAFLTPTSTPRSTR